MSGHSTMASFNMNHFNALTKDLTQIKALYITLYYVYYIIHIILYKKLINNK